MNLKFLCMTLSTDETALNYLRREVLHHHVDSPLANWAPHFGLLETIRARKARDLVRGCPMDEAGVPLARHADDTAAVVILIRVFLVRSGFSLFCGNHVFHLLEAPPPDGLLRRQCVRASTIVIFRFCGVGVLTVCTEPTPQRPCHRLAGALKTKLASTTVYVRRLDEDLPHDTALYESIAPPALTASIARSFLALARRAFRSCAFTP